MSPTLNRRQAWNGSNDWSGPQWLVSAAVERLERFERAYLKDMGRISTVTAESSD
jgi:hypothetical protein